MNKIMIVIVFCLLTGVSMGGSFELADPAAEILEEQDNPEEYAQPQGDTGGTRDEWVSDGIGDTACGDHLASRQESSETYSANLIWLQGFIDGVAYQRFITLGDYRLSPAYEPESMAVWIENYCQTNPPDSLVQAARAFLIKISQ